MNNLAWITCEVQQEYQQALELAEKGLKMAPKYVDLIDTRGVVYYRLGDYQKAVQDFTVCLQLYPDRAPAKVACRFHLARTLAKLGQTDTAVKELDQALQMQGELEGLSDQELSEAQHLREQLQKGS
jgi:tetratricopeptide (TPR) repeat protein